MKKIAYFLLLVVFATNGAFAQGGKVFNIKSESSITYAMTHPMHDWEGVSKDFLAVAVFDKNNVDIAQIAVSVKVATFDSQNANRDSHMIEAVEGIKYPNVTFSSTSIKRDGDKYTITGKLTFHGVEQIITCDANYAKKGDKRVFTSSFTTTMSAHKIEAPTLMGVAADDEIKMRFEIVFPQ